MHKIFHIVLLGLLGASNASYYSQMLSLDHKLFFCPKRELSKYPDIIQDTNSVLVSIQASDYREDWYHNLDSHSHVSGYSAYATVQESSDPDFTVVFTHGTGDDIYSLLHEHGPFAKRMAERLNARVILIDYPGCGFLLKNAGWRWPSQLYALAGSRAVLRHLLAENIIDLSKTIFIGQSLGTGMATDLVHGLEQASRPPAGLVLVSAYTTIREAVVDFARIPLAVNNLVFTNNFDSRRRIQGISKTPTRFIHGTEDNDIKPRHSQELFDAQTQCHDKQLWLIEGSDHCDIWRDDVYARLKSFADERTSTHELHSVLHQTAESHSTPPSWFHKWINRMKGKVCDLC